MIKPVQEAGSTSFPHPKGRAMPIGNGMWFKPVGVIGNCQPLSHCWGRWVAGLSGTPPGPNGRAQLRPVTLLAIGDRIAEMETKAAQAAERQWRAPVASSKSSHFSPPPPTPARRSGIACYSTEDPAPTGRRTRSPLGTSTPTLRIAAGHSQWSNPRSSWHQHVKQFYISSRGAGRAGLFKAWAAAFRRPPMPSTAGPAPYPLVGGAATHRKSA